jgi:lanosterol synthase
LIPYEDVRWIAARDDVADVDCYASHHPLLNVANMAMGVFERFHSSWLRQWALKEVVDHIRADDRNTKCISIGPISKVINMLVMWHHDGPNSPAFMEHIERVPDYLWLAEDGMRMQGTNGSQLWDTALAVFGALEAGLDQYPEFQTSFTEAYKFMDDCQIKENTQDYEKYYRQVNKGAFPFSTRDCGWIVSDCTAEGLKATLYLHQLPFITR